MGTLDQCDGCKIISPDKEGLHISNHWIEIKFSHGIKDRAAGRVERSWHTKELCEACFEKAKQAITQF